MVKPTVGVQTGSVDGDTSSEGVVVTAAARHGTDEAEHSNTAGESGSRLMGHSFVIEHILTCPISHLPVTLSTVSPVTVSICTVSYVPVSLSSVSLAWSLV